MKLKTAVVIPAHNAEATIARAVLSAVEQADEVWVGDDGSADATAHLAREAGAQVLELPKANANVARNACVLQSSGEFVFSLDADDWYLPGKVAAHLAAHEQHTPSLVFDPGTWTDEGGATHGLSGPALGRSVGFRGFTSRRYWYGGSTYSFRREVFDAIGGYREELTSQQDLDFWIRAAYRAGPAFVLGTSLTAYTMSASSLSRNPVNVVPNMLRLLGGLPFLGFADRRRFWCHVMFNTADQLPFRRALPFLLRALDRVWDPRFAKSVARSLRKGVGR